MNRLHKFIFISIIAASSSTVAAQGYTGPSVSSIAPAGLGYTGPSGVPAMTTKQLLTNGVDDQYVTLTGKLARHTGGENYVFSDASGEIQVEVSPKYFPADRAIDANTVIVLIGKFDKERFGTSKLEVEQAIRVLQ